MQSFRKVVFWLHLAAGVVAGISIGIMCFTGAALAFEKEIVAWSERDARQVVVPAPNTPRLSLAELTMRISENMPDARPSGITVSKDPRHAVVFSFGRDGALYADPYTGEIRTPASTKVHDLLHVLEDWHRVLALGGDRRAIGKAINGACNVAFSFLAVSGLYLWWPRRWSPAGFKAVAVMNWKLAGKARDFNWHNSIGLWSAPILIVLTVTAMPISYRWAGNLIYRLVGEEVPSQGPGPGASSSGGEGRGAAATSDGIKRPSPEARPLSHDALLAKVQEQTPAWSSITFRLASLQRGRPPVSRESPRGVSGADTPKEASVPQARGESRRDESGRGSEGRRGPQPVTLVVKEPGSWPRTATTTLTLNPFSGEILKTEGFAGLSTGRQIRSWMRFLHTGEALGWLGQLIAGLACLGGCLLVYTGFALGWRRFFGKGPPTPERS